MDAITQLNQQVGAPGSLGRWGNRGTPEQASLLQKALAPSSNYIGINLEPRVQMLLPLYTPVRELMPSDTPAQGGPTARFKMTLAYGVSFGTHGTAVGGIGSAQALTAIELAAPYCQQAFYDDVYLATMDQARGFESPMSASVDGLTASILRMDDLMCMGANYTALGAPGSLTLTTSTGGGTIPTGTYSIGVSALTLEGYTTGSVGGSLAYGESTVLSVSTGGITGMTNSIDAVWQAVPGAVAYNVYMWSASTWKYVRTCTMTSTILKTPYASVVGNSVPGSDTTGNTNAYEGLIAWADKATVYGQAITGKVTVTDLSGAALTQTSDGVTEIDNVLQSIFTNWKTGPTHILTDPYGARALSKAVINTGTGGGPTFIVNVTQNQRNFTGGFFMGGYLNKFVGTIPTPTLPSLSILTRSTELETSEFVKNRMTLPPKVPLGEPTAAMSRKRSNTPGPAEAKYPVKMLCPSTPVAAGYVLVLAFPPSIWLARVSCPFGDSPVPITSSDWICTASTNPALHARVKVAVPEGAWFTRRS